MNATNDGKTEFEVRTIKRNLTFLSKFIEVNQTDKLLDAIMKFEFRVTLACAVIALTSIVTVVYEVNFRQSERFYSEITDETTGFIVKKSNERDLTNEYLRICNIILAVPMRNIHLVILIYFQADLKLQELKCRKVLTESGSFYSATLKSSSILYRMLVEMFVTGVCMPPYFDYTFSGEMLRGFYTYSADSLISIFTLSRIWLIFKLYPLVSMWVNKKTYLLSMKVGYRPNFFFALKADLKFRPYIFIFFAVGIVAFVMGFSVHNFEKSYESDTKTDLDLGFITNGLWLAILTLTSIGYGDGYPSTHFGRFTMICTAFIGLVLMSLYLITIVSGTIFEANEAKAFSMIHAFKTKSKINFHAANTIKDAFRLRKHICSQGNSNYLWDIIVQVGALQSNIAKFKLESSDNQETKPSRQDMISDLDYKLTSKINAIKNELIDVKYIGKRLKDLIASQKELAKSIDNISETMHFISSLANHSFIN